jgi:hypothetical protein
VEAAAAEEEHAEAAAAEEAGRDDGEDGDDRALEDEMEVKKRKEDFMILTAETSSMDDEVKAVHMLFHLARDGTTPDDADDERCDHGQADDVRDDTGL